MPHTPPLQPNQIHWPYLVIDFEASGLGEGTYPIEIGLARWAGPGHRAQVWSSLIQPTAEWTKDGIWSAKSEQIHHIPRHRLAQAPAVETILAAANRFAGIGSLAFCDGGRYDAYWLLRLELAAQANASFQLGSIQRICTFMSKKQLDRYLNFRAPHEVVHRAAEDAKDHIRAMAYALDLPEPEFDEITTP